MIDWIKIKNLKKVPQKKYILIYFPKTVRAYIGFFLYGSGKDRNTIFWTYFSSVGPITGHKKTMMAPTHYAEINLPKKRKKKRCKRKKENDR